MLRDNLNIHKFLYCEDMVNLSTYFQHKVWNMFPNKTFKTIFIFPRNMKDNKNPVVNLISTTVVNLAAAIQKEIQHCKDELNIENDD